MFVVSGIRAETAELPTDTGYRGIWYSNQPSKDKYHFKYSGGMATYPQQHSPIAIHAPQVDKTFFVYGGSPKDKRRLLHMVSYFDHATGKLPRPRILLDKETTDAHDNPTLAIDREGYLYIFSNAHGTSRPSFVHRSTAPFDIRSFEKIWTTNFSYSQPWYLGDGFLLLHTRYAQGRKLHWVTSPNGRDWSEPRLLAAIEQGHYQVSGCRSPASEDHAGVKATIGTAFNMHPQKGGLNARTNLYYLETADAGQTWTLADGTPVKMPIEDRHHPALVHDYQTEGLLVYLKDVRFDHEGRPVLLYLTSRGYAAGPASDPRTWRLACWTGKDWRFEEITRSDHNYDYGSLYLEAPDRWRLIAPTEPGPQPYHTGGQVAIWRSADQGRTWERERILTHDERFNHTYVRRPLDAHPDFYALWADGDGSAPSDSRLFFTNRAGDRVWQLPQEMSTEEEPALARW